MQRLYNLTFWQTLAAGFFVVGFAGYLAEGFEAVALEEWNIHDDPRSLHIASSYEAFWCFAMVPWFVTGLGNAWLPLADSLGLPEHSPAEQQVRAKLSMLWAVGMLGFWPVSWWKNNGLRRAAATNCDCFSWTTFRSNTRGRRASSKGGKGPAVAGARMTDDMVTAASCCCLYPRCITRSVKSRCVFCPVYLAPRFDIDIGDWAWHNHGSV